jgi:hypothetical protein
MSVEATRQTARWVGVGGMDGASSVFRRAGGLVPALGTLQRLLARWARRRLLGSGVMATWRRGAARIKKPLRDETTIVVALDQVHYFASFLRRRTCSRPVKGPASCLRESHVRNRQAPLHQVGRVGSNHKEMRVETDSIILRTAALDALTPC